MEFRQLECFVVVAEELNFTKAARRLHVVQSAVSTAIRTLEHEVGSPLFDRDSRHVELTDAGAAMLPHARAALASGRAAKEAAEEGQGELRGSVAVGTLLSTVQLDLPRVLARFRRRHPRVTVRIRHSAEGSSGHVRALLEGDLDFALVSLPRRAPAGLTAEPLGEDALRLVCSPRHALARRKNVALAELAEETFVDFPQGWGSRDLVDLAFARAELARTIAIEATEYGTLAALVRRNVGVAFMPGSSSRLPGLASVDVPADALRWTVSVAHQASRALSRPAAALLAEVRADAGRTPPVPA